MQVTIGVPSLGIWKDVMGLSLARSLIGWTPDVHLAQARGPHIDENREVIVHEALDAKSDYLIFIDSDMAWPRESLHQLLDVAQGKDIIGAAYNEKRLPPVSTVKMLNADGSVFVGVKEMPHEPFECAAVGAGFMCIDLKRLVSEWPHGAYFEFGSKDGFERLGEDIAFCTKARERGLTVWCDPRIKLAHIGDQAF